MRRCPHALPRSVYCGISPPALIHCAVVLSANVLDWAKAKKLRDGDDPARWKGLLDELLPAPSKVSPVEHHKGLPYADLPRFMAELR